MLVGHTVDEGHDDVETRHQDAVEFAQPLDDPGVLLGHDLEGLDGKDNGQDQDGDGDGGDRWHRWSLLKDGYGMKAG